MLDSLFELAIPSGLTGVGRQKVDEAGAAMLLMAGDTQDEDMLFASWLRDSRPFLLITGRLRQMTNVANACGMMG